MEKGGEGKIWGGAWRLDHQGTTAAFWGWFVESSFLSLGCVCLEHHICDWDGLMGGCVDWFEGFGVRFTNFFFFFFLAVDRDAIVDDYISVMGGVGKCHVNQNLGIIFKIWSWRRWSNFCWLWEWLVSSKTEADSIL